VSHKISRLFSTANNRVRASPLKSIPYYSLALHIQGMWKCCHKGTCDCNILSNRHRIVALGDVMPRRYCITVVRRCHNCGVLQWSGMTIGCTCNDCWRCIMYHTLSCLRKCRQIHSEATVISGQEASQLHLNSFQCWVHNRLKKLDMHTTTESVQ
jgi:hypothetical protein